MAAAAAGRAAAFAALAAAAGGAIPEWPLRGGGAIPMLAMGGNDFAGWFKAGGRMIQTFHGCVGNCDGYRSVCEKGCGGRAGCPCRIGFVLFK